MYGLNQYGINKYGYDLPTDEDILKYKVNLNKYVPWFVYKTEQCDSVYDAQSTEIGLLNYYIEDVRKQFFINTATWGLVYWEDKYGIETDLNKSYEERREIVKAKKRGRGTTTKKMIQETAEAFSGGDVNIIEHPERYSFTVKFIGIKGIPRNLAAFKEMLDNIKPAHLAYDFQYTYTVWDFLKNKQLTWNNAKLKTWNELKVYD